MKMSLRVTSARSAILLLLLMGGCDLMHSSDQAVLAGGETTVFAEFSNAYQLPAVNLSAAETEEHRQGDVAFEAAFVTAPASVRGGLGPLFNQNACASCHSKNGRAPAPVTGRDRGGFFLKLSHSGAGAHGEPLGVSGFGGQLQTKAVYGKQPEAQGTIRYELLQGAFADGETYTLRKPIYEITNPYTPMPAHVLTSPRIAPPVFGLGLLESIPEADILQHADETDRDGDGISGRPNYVWDFKNGKRVLGRFGWKANNPNLLQQTAGAFLGDMGLTTSIFRQEEFAGQPQDDGLADDPEVDDRTLFLATYYTQSLGVPAARRQNDPAVRKGRELFRETGCQNCHTASFKTASSAAFGFLSNQTIAPYTDLLLHDMGVLLADQRPDYEASGREWRTPPLWCIGLTQVVSGHTNFLHDGRARSLQEAILWHGGEAENSVVRYKKLSKQDRDRIIAFLNAL